MKHFILKTISILTIVAIPLIGNATKNTTKNYMKEQTKLQQLIELSKKYETLHNVSAYNWWTNPYKFPVKGRDGSNPSIFNKYHFKNFQALGGSGIYNWNRSYLNGTSIAIMYYKISTGASIDIENKNYYDYYADRFINNKNLELLYQHHFINNKNLELLTDFEINLIKELVSEANNKFMLEYEQTKEYKLKNQWEN
jgi:hypothetical protein